MTQNVRKKFRISVQKNLSALLSVALILNPATSFAAPNPFVPAIASNEVDISNIQNRTISIPNTLGNIEKIIPSSQGTVIHIQDAHSQVDAQFNIGKILEHLFSQYGINAVFVEGGMHGVISPNLLRFFNDNSLDEKIANKFIQEGLAGGAGLFTLQAPQGKFNLYGVEDPKLYRKNLMLYRKVYQHKTAVDPFMSELKLYLSTLGSHYFNPELRDFLNSWLLFQDSKREMLNHLNALKKTAHEKLTYDLSDAKNQFDFPQLVRYFKMLEQEANPVNSRALGYEKEAFFSWLKQNELTQFTEKFENLITQSEFIQPRDPRSLLEDFYAASKSKGFKAGDYPNLFKHLGLRTLHDEMDTEKLFIEIHQITSQILERLSKNDQERTLIQSLQEYQLLRKFFDLEVSRDEFKQVLSLKNSIHPNIFIQRLSRLKNDKIKSSPVSNPSISSAFRTAVFFYHAAFQRENRIYENMESLSKENGIRNKVLIAGGFHQAGIEHLAKSASQSYISITPRISKIQDNKMYVSRMLLKTDRFSSESSVVHTRFDALTVASMESAVGTTATQNLVGLGNEIIFEISGARTPQLVLPETAKPRPELRAKMEITSMDEASIGPVYAAGLLVQESVRGKIEAATDNDMVSPKDMTPDERSRYLGVGIKALQDGQLGSLFLLGGVGSRMPMNKYPESLRPELARFLNLVTDRQAQGILASTPVGERDEMLASLLTTSEHYASSGEVLTEPEFRAKGLVPVVKVDNRWYTFSGLHFANHRNVLTQLNISPNRFPAILATGAQNRADFERFMRFTGHADQLSLMGYTGHPGRRVVAVTKDVDAELKKLVASYVTKFVPTLVIVPGKKAGEATEKEVLAALKKIQDPAYLDILRQIDRRHKAVHAYQDSVEEVRGRLTSESLEPPVRDWLEAKWNLLTANAARVRNLTGAEIERLLETIEANIPKDAEAIRLERVATGARSTISLLPSANGNPLQGEGKELLETQISEIFNFRENYVPSHAGEVLPIAAPRGHGGILHNMFNDAGDNELILKFLERGIRYLSARNVDNTPARFDEDWLIAVGYTIEHGLDMLFEASRRPVGQSGGTLIKHMERPGTPTTIAEDPSLAGTTVNPADSPNINDAVAVIDIVNYLSKVYQTSVEELESIRKMPDATARRQRLKEIQLRGFKRYPINPVPKFVQMPKNAKLPSGAKHPLAGKWVVGTVFETNMWESTGVEPTLKTKAMKVGSVEDLVIYLKEKIGLKEEEKLTNRDIDNYLASIQGTPAFDEFIKFVKWIRFAPNKGWEDYEGIQKYVVNVIAPYIVSGDLFPSLKPRRAELRVLPEEVNPYDDAALANAYSQKLLVQYKVETTPGTKQALKPEESPSLRDFSPEQRGRQKGAMIKAMKRGEVATVVLTGGASTRIRQTPFSQYPADLKADFPPALSLVRRTGPQKTMLQGPIGQPDEMTAALMAVAATSETNITPKSVADQGKGLLPVVKIDGKWHNFLGLHLTNQARLMGQLKIRKDLMPSLVVLGATTASSHKRFLDLAGHTNVLDILPYSGIPRSRAVPRIDDINGQFHKLVKEYIKRIKPGFTMPNGKDSSTLSDNEIKDLTPQDLEFAASKIIERRLAYLAYLDAVNDVARNLELDNLLTADKIDWYVAKGQLLIENYEALVNLKGPAIRALKDEIESKVSPRAAGITVTPEIKQSTLQKLKEISSVSRSEKNPDRFTREMVIEDLAAFRNYAKEHQAELLPIAGPGGHAGTLHHLFNDQTNQEVLLQLIKRGVKYLYLRNVDNTTARFDEDWLVEGGYFIEQGFDAMFEGSTRPSGPGGAGGGFVKHLDISGQPTSIAEDASLRGTSINIRESLINNATAFISLEYIFKVYQTSREELMEVANIDDPTERRERLREISARGFRRYPFNPTPKLETLPLKATNGDGSPHPFAGRSVVTIYFDTNMWESSGIISEPPAKIGVIRTDSVQDLKIYLSGKIGVSVDAMEKVTDEHLRKIDAYLESIKGTPAYDEFIDHLRWIRFAPTKEFDDYIGLNQLIVKHIAPYLVNGNLLTAFRSELRKESGISFEEGPRTIAAEQIEAQILVANQIVWNIVRANLEQYIAGKLGFDDSSIRDTWLDGEVARVVAAIKEGVIPPAKSFAATLSPEIVQAIRTPENLVTDMEKMFLQTNLEFAVNYAYIPQGISENQLESMLTGLEPVLARNENKVLVLATAKDLSPSAKARIQERFDGRVIIFGQVQAGDYHSFLTSMIGQGQFEGDRRASDAFRLKVQSLFKNASGETYSMTKVQEASQVIGTEALFGANGLQIPIPGEFVTEDTVGIDLADLVASQISLSLVSSGIKAADIQARAEEIKQRVADYLLLSPKDGGQRVLTLRINPLRLNAIVSLVQAISAYQKIDIAA